MLNKISRENTFVTKVKDVFPKKSEILIIKYKLLILSFTLLLLFSCKQNKDSVSESLEKDKTEIKSREKINPLDKYEVKSVSPYDFIKVYKDTLLYVVAGNYEYSYLENDDLGKLTEELNEIKEGLAKFSPNYLKNMNINEIEGVFLLKKIIRKSEKTGKTNFPPGLYYKNTISLSDGDQISHEMSHVIDAKRAERLGISLKKHDEKWARSIYGQNFADFFGKHTGKKRPNGMIDAYSAQSVQEVRAVIYEYIMSGGTWAESEGINDSLLKKAIQSIRKEIENDSNGEMGKEWQKILETGKTYNWKNYWESR